MNMLDMMGKLIGEIGHTDWLGMKYRAHGSEWIEFILPWRDDLAVESRNGGIATGPIFSFLDTAMGGAIMHGQRKPVSMATIGMRVDYTRPSRRGHDLICRCECYRMTRNVAFVRGLVCDVEIADPLAHASGTYVLQSGEEEWAYGGLPVAKSSADARTPTFPFASENQGDCVFTVEFSDLVAGRPGFVHGGVVASLLEHAASMVLRRRLDEDANDSVAKPVTTSVEYLRSARSDRIFAAARIARLGQRFARVEAEAWQDHRSSPVAKASLTLAISEKW